MLGKTASKYLKQNLIDLKEETDIATRARTADYSTLISVIDRGSRREKTKQNRNNLESVTNSITYPDLIDI